MCQFAWLLPAAILLGLAFCQYLKKDQGKWASHLRVPSADTFSKRPAVTTAESSLAVYKVYLPPEVVLAGECSHVPKHFKKIHHNTLDEKATETLHCLVPASCTAGRYSEGGNYLDSGNTREMRTLSSANYESFPLRRNFKQSAIKDGMWKY